MTRLLTNLRQPTLLNKPPLNIPSPQFLPAISSLRINSHNSNDMTDPSILRNPHRGPRPNTGDITDSFLAPMKHLTMTDEPHDRLEQERAKAEIRLVMT